MTSETCTSVASTEGDVFAMRNWIREMIDGYGFASLDLDQTEDGEPRFGLINPETGDVWIVTVTEGSLVPVSQEPES
jgi:hypothetical protein